MNILITGASGSGTSTLGKKLSKSLPDYKYLDADDFFWLQTDPPYQTKRKPQERLSSLLIEMQNQNVVLSGTIIKWGSELEDQFDLIVFLHLDSDIRLKRLKERELKKLGYVDNDFLSWASEYDNPEFAGRNIVKHQAWLSQRKCNILKLEDDQSTEERLSAVLEKLEHAK